MLMSGCVDALCFAPHGWEQKLIAGGLCWGPELSLERAGTTTVVLTTPGSDSMHLKPGEILSPACTDLILGVNSLLVSAQRSKRGVMWKGEFLR